MRLQTQTAAAINLSFITVDIYFPLFILKAKQFIYKFELDQSQLNSFASEFYQICRNVSRQFGKIRGFCTHAIPKVKPLRRWCPGYDTKFYVIFLCIFHIDYS